MAGSRFVANRAALDEVVGGFADGVFDITRAILDVAVARAPDAEPFGEGLVDQGAAIVWVGKKRTHQVRTDGSTKTVPKPRQSPKLAEGIITGMVGFGFPASLVEFDTLHRKATPFLTPAIAEVAPDAEITLSEAMQRRLRGERNVKVAKRIAGARMLKKRRATRAKVKAYVAGGGTTP